MEFMRHGDVYLLKVDAVPQGERKPIGGPVLAEGEATGHKHELMTLDGVERYEIEGRCYLEVSEQGVSIAHPEHGEAVIAPGIYEVVIDREYDYSARAVRRVAD